MSKEINNDSQGNPMDFKTLKVRKEEAVLFVQIDAPPMNLNGPELVRDLVSLIQTAVDLYAPAAACYYANFWSVIISGVMMTTSRPT
jgi:hypothetical protein